MSRVAVVVDFANIDRAANDHGITLNYRHLLEYLASESDGRSLVEAFCYVPIDPRNPHARDRKIDELATDGFLVRTKVGAIADDSYKCDFDVEMTMELMRISHDLNPDIIILCSGDRDFVPVIEYLRSKGIRVEVASFISTTSRDVILKCSSFIDLAVYAEELRGAADGAEPEVAAAVGNE
jgi:uncharacterized LabA/DUF88 family protein